MSDGNPSAPKWWKLLQDIESEFGTLENFQAGQSAADWASSRGYDLYTLTESILVASEMSEYLRRKLNSEDCQKVKMVRHVGMSRFEYYLMFGEEYVGRMVIKESYSPYKIDSYFSPIGERESNSIKNRIV